MGKVKFNLSDYNMDLVNHIKKIRNDSKLFITFKEIYKFFKQLRTSKISREQYDNFKFDKRTVRNYISKSLENEFLVADINNDNVKENDKKYFLSKNYITTDILEQLENKCKTILQGTSEKLENLNINKISSKKNYANIDEMKNETQYIKNFVSQIKNEDYNKINITEEELWKTLQIIKFNIEILHTLKNNSDNLIALATSKDFSNIVTRGYEMLKK
jgi:hypothetical protein